MTLFFATLYYFFTFLVGISIGSFLNCLAWRLEKGEKITGRSHCPHCKKTLAPKDLIPLLSFFYLKGKCRYCQKKLSWQYPLVEFFTGIFFFMIFYYHNLHTFFDMVKVVFLLYVVSSMIVIFIYDLRNYIIPDVVLFPAIFVTFLYRLTDISYLYLYIFAALMASGFFLIIFLISSGKWIGFGDVKLAILMGLLLGFPNILAGLFLAFLFGAIIGVILIAKSKKKLKSEIPFAPFLILGTFLAMFFGEQLIVWYVSSLLW